MWTIGRYWQRHDLKVVGAPEALCFVRRLATIEPPAAAFDAAFSSR